MPSESGPGAVRSHGTPPAASARPPGRRLLVLVLGMALGGLVVTWAAADPSSESERSAITSPTVDDAPSTTVVSDIALPAPPIPDPLDQRVPGFTGTLVLTMGTSEGTEVWRWGTGGDGVLERTAPTPDLYDAVPDPTGSVVAAIRRFGREAPSLRMATAAEWSPVFWGVGQFARHPTEPGAVAWFEASDATDDDATIHMGRWNGDGVYFRPVYLPATADDSPIADRLVAFDRHGLVFERHLGTGGMASVRIERVNVLGTLLATVDGFFVGASPDGQVAVSDGVTTRLVDGASLDQTAQFGAVYHSMAWTGDGRIAAADREGTVVDLIDGAAIRSVEVGDIGPSVLTWSPDGRFIVASGHAGDDPVLAFIDSATLDLTVLLVSGHPVAAVALP